MMFIDAFIDEMSFPSLDATSKAPTSIVVKLHAEKIVRKVSNSSVPVKLPDASKSKRMTAASFRLRIDGLEQVTNSVKDRSSNVQNQNGWRASRHAS